MTSVYVRYVMKSGTVIEVKDFVEFNGFRFDGKAPRPTPKGGRPNVHYFETADGEKYYVDQDEAAAIIFGPHSVPPAMAERPILGFSVPEVP